MIPETQDTRSALVIIDMQNAMFHGKAKPHDADFVVRRVCALIDRARREDVQIVFVQHAGAGLEHGSDGWRLIAALRPQFPDWVVDKMGASIFAGTNLAAQLKAVGIKRLILAGASTDDGIATSCREAVERGFDVVLAADAHTLHARDAEARIARHNATLAGAARVLEAGEVAFA
jgi:nicotinamidase-related amidase